MILMLQMCLVFGQKKVVVIDVGHGGKDSGAIGINGIQEKEVV
ncbi:MAG: N-acetylmuramoyl-L-alanine amidase, partial [Flavobacteriaceae bacterium]